jgi:hypothetical protein
VLEESDDLTVAGSSREIKSYLSIVGHYLGIGAMPNQQVRRPRISVLSR